ncbi:MAG: M81 family metallopeptidase [Ruminococcaceae bacterium]|nr:M81 family metallopeptidase [Oscillospiraceae bacterium]
MKILLGGLNQEVNSFSPGKTTIEEYRRKQYCLGDDMLRAAAGHVRAYSDLFDAMGGAYNVLVDGGAEVVSGGFAGAQSGGIIEQSVLDGYIAYIKEAARNNLPLDGVVLVMHGAAQSEGSDDPEGDIITAVREVVGENVPIAVSLDLHANVTEQMATNADTISLYQHYPHVDIWETGERAARLCLGMVKGEIAPKMAYVSIPMIVPASAYTTETEPFLSLMNKAHAYVTSGKLLDFSISQMQPWLDVPKGGSSVIAIGENGEEAARIAEELAKELWEMRHEFKTELSSVDEVIRIAEKNNSGKPVILNDFADSANAGSAGDSAEVIERVLALGSNVKGLMYLNDSEFVEVCRRAGVGNTVKAPLGATISKKLYTPVLVEAQVKALYDGDMFIHGNFTNFGACALVKIRNMLVVVTTQHFYPGDPALYRAYGYDPMDFQMVVVKACTSFRAFYGPLTDLIYPVVTKGAASADLLSLPFEKLPRSFYPFSDGDFVPVASVFGK